MVENLLEQETPLSSPQLFHELPEMPVSSGDRAGRKVDLTKHGTHTTSYKPHSSSCDPIAPDQFSASNEGLLKEVKSSNGGDKIEKLFEDFRRLRGSTSGRQLEEKGLNFGSEVPVVRSCGGGVGVAVSTVPNVEVTSRGKLGLAKTGAMINAPAALENIQAADEEEKALLVNAMLLLASEESTL